MEGHCVRVYVPTIQTGTGTPVFYKVDEAGCFPTEKMGYLDSLYLDDMLIMAKLPELLKQHL